MLNVCKHILFIVMCFSGGVIISGAIFSFIAVIGVVPSMAYKTKTTKYVKCFETAIILGGIFGTTTNFIDYYIPLPNILTSIYALSIGVFIGVLASSLAETLDVIPIFTRRLKIQKGLIYFMLSIGIGKLVGSLLYFTVKGFKS